MRFGAFGYSTTSVRATGRGSWRDRSERRGQDNIDQRHLRMLPPTSGQVLLGVADVTAKPFHAISRKGVVRSFQQTNTFRSASARENLERAARFSASDSSSDIGLDSLLQEFGLSDHLDEPSDKLPYGLQKMLGLLMTLAARPRFLLLDEPAAGLERRERPRIDCFVTHARSILAAAC
jgi:branched-chain amino acid transport system ATP-binding protein